MKYLCLRNFSCNKVSGFPGKELGKQEIEDIKDFIPELVNKELIRGIELPKKEAKKEKQEKKSDKGLAE